MAPAPQHRNWSISPYFQARHQAISPGTQNGQRAPISGPGTAPVPELVNEPLFTIQAQGNWLISQFH